MGYKMNGSPAKLGTIQGTSSHSSALKQKELSGFEKAFAAARKRDDDHFTFNGKTYNTSTKEEKGPPPQSGTYHDPHNVHARKTEGLKEEQRAKRKANCAKRGGTWNSTTDSCD